MNDTLVPRNEAWSLIAMTSRVCVRKRARTSCDMGTDGALLHEGQQPPEADEALARLGDELAVLAEAFEHLAEVAHHAAFAARRAEDFDRGAIEIGGHAFDDVGDAIDDGFEQAREHRGR